MATGFYPLPRVEGGLTLEQTDDGQIRLTGQPQMGLEARITQRPSAELGYLPQLISADSGIAHAIAALHGLETLAEQPPPPNGRRLRELLHLLSILHAHLRRLYLGALPDYLPLAALQDYAGSIPGLQRVGEAIAARPDQHWLRASFEHPLDPAQVRQVAESLYWAQQCLTALQRAIALIGGKYPVAMSLFAGGLSTPLDALRIQQLRQTLEPWRGFLREAPLASALILLQAYPALLNQSLGEGPRFSAGVPAAEDALFSPGAVNLERVLPPQPVITESLATSFYRIAESPVRGLPWVPVPERPGAYSWIKAPRLDGQAMSTGPLARMSLLAQRQTRPRATALVERLERALGAPLSAPATLGSHLLSRAAECTLIAARVDELLGALEPDQPVIAWQPRLTQLTGNTRGAVDGPDGALHHTFQVERGMIVSYDIIGAGTWNGSSTDEGGRRGIIERALNTLALDLSRPNHLRQASRLVQATGFSMSDAVH